MTTNRRKMTDGRAMRIAVRMWQHLDAVVRLSDELKESDHPNANQIGERLWDNGIPAISDPVAIVHHELTNPDRWEISTGNYKRKRATP
jgi:hypothetical protein